MIALLMTPIAALATALAFSAPVVAVVTPDYTIDCNAGATQGGITFENLPVGSNQWIYTVTLPGTAIATKTVSISNCDLHIARNAYPSNFVINATNPARDGTYTINVPVDAAGDVWGYNIWSSPDVTYIIEFRNFAPPPPPPAAQVTATSSGGGSASATDADSDGTWDLSATADANFSFSNWSCDNGTPASSSSASTTISPSVDTACTANFSPISTFDVQGLGYWKKADLSSPQLPTNLGNYSVDSQWRANNVFRSTNCGVKNFDATGCLAGHLLVAKLNVSSGAIAFCIAWIIEDADDFLEDIGYNGPNRYSLNKGQRSEAIYLKDWLELYSKYGCFE
jgi:hypothetical protein